MTEGAGSSGAKHVPLATLTLLLWKCWKGNPDCPHSQWKWLPLWQHQRREGEEQSRWPLRGWVVEQRPRPSHSKHMWVCDSPVCSLHVHACGLSPKACMFLESRNTSALYWNPTLHLAQCLIPGSCLVNVCWGLLIEDVSRPRSPLYAQLWSLITQSRSYRRCRDMSRICTNPWSALWKPHYCIWKKKFLTACFLITGFSATCHVRKVFLNKSLSNVNS